MATTAELMQSLREALGRNTAFWTDDELIQNGLNPAQNLLVLVDRTQCTRRQLLPVVAGQAWLDLRQVAPRLLALQRVLVGSQVADVPTVSQADFRPLTPSSRQSLAVRGRWLLDVGTVRQYYLHGRYLLGLYRRPAADITLTLVYRSLPQPLSIDAQAQEPELAAGVHSLIADVAAPLLLVKEGQMEAKRAAETLRYLLGEELTLPLWKALRAVQQLVPGTQENAYAAP